ncbi:MAG TPA: hypothetical protein VKV39_02755 [Candidatus Sulfotelmatobacter sp.]|nr:hypothetical protein [Candidatus Sulfotelmatobacter sp.]
MNYRLHAPWIAIVIALAAGPPARTAYAANDKAPAHPPTRQVSTEQGSLELSGVDIKKGDLQETVMRQLSQLYQLQKLRSAQGEEDSWLISEKAEPDNYVGVVSFDSGKVRRVARFRKWTQDDDSVELAQRLCDLLENLTRERGTQASITARENESGGVSVRGVEMVFGDKRVSFNIVSRGDGDAKQTEVHLDEVIQ